MDEIVLKICSGPQVGETIRVSSRPLVFGRTSLADVVFDWDPLVSSKHLEIQRVAGEFLLRDLNSRNGTKVNGEKVDNCNLATGDQIKLGGVVLQVEKIRDHSDGARAGAETVSGTFNPFERQNPIDDDDEEVDTADETSADALELSATREECPSGLLRLRGPVPEEAAPSDLVERIVSYDGQLMMIVNYKSLGMGVPQADVMNSSPFRPYVEPQAVLQLPIVVEREEMEDWKSVVDQAWGKNALIVVGTQLSKIELVEKISDLMSRSPDGQGYSGGGILGICWPAVLSALLFTGSDQVSQALMKFIDLVYIENENAGDEWQLFGSQELVTQAAESGNVEIVDNKAAPAQSS